jgi:hypothetical protein
MIAAVNIPVMFQNEAITACSTMGAERRGISHNNPKHKIKVLYENFSHIFAGDPFIQDSVQKSTKLQGINTSIRNPAIDDFHKGDELKKVGTDTFQIFIYVFWMKAIPVVHSNKAGYAFQEAPGTSGTNRFWDIDLLCPDKSSIGIADYKQALPA